MAEELESKKRILILVPGANARGGITNYYSSLKNHFTLPVDYMERGSRTWPARKGMIPEFSRIIRDTWKFFKLIRTGKYRLVQTTTAFSSLALFRDALFILIASFYHVKIIVFYRGWDVDLANKIRRRYLKLFKWVYFRADAVIDLSLENIQRLQSWGFSKPCYPETTVVSRQLVSGINEDFIRKRASKDPESFNLLFLSRVEVTKGIYEAIETYVILKEKHKSLSMTIAGDGSELDNIYNYIYAQHIPDISISGFIENNTKAEVFRKADLFIFPSHFEGMPNALLEAMSFGIPIVTRSVGGLPDFFINGKNGYITESKEPKVFAELIEKLLDNKKLYDDISFNNYQFAMSHFVSDVVVKRIENIFIKTMNS